MKATIALFLLAVASLAAGSPSMQKFEQKSDLELIDLLTNSDSATRCASLIVLADRFNDPDAVIVMGPTFGPSYPRGVPLRPELLERTSALAMNDQNMKVRLAAVMALESFRFRTNTTPILTALLGDRTCIIRIRAAQGLIGFADNYQEPISDNVVSTLISCLDTNNLPDYIWQAAETLGDLGARAKESLPLLAKLKHSESPQVREYAREAARKIRKGLSKEKR